MKLTTQQTRDIINCTEAGQYVSEYLINKVRLLYVNQPVLPANATSEQKAVYNTAVDQFNKDIQIEAFARQHKALIENSHSLEKTIFAQALASLDYWPDSVSNAKSPTDLWQQLVAVKSPNSNVPFVDLVIEDMLTKKLTPLKKVELASD